MPSCFLNVPSIIIISSYFLRPRKVLLRLLTVPLTY
jgi:hypothetical protein